MWLSFVMIACMNFIFTNLNTIALAVWFVFFCIVAVRILRPAWVKNTSYRWIVIGAITLHFLYGIVVTLGQARVWATGSDITKALFSAPLSPEVPFPSYLEWVRPLFEHTHGYFAFYSFQHFFLSTIALFFITGLFALFFKIYSQYRHLNLKEGDIAIIALLFLIAGWPGVIVLVPLGFILAIFLAVFALLKPAPNNQIDLPRAFLFATPFALIFATPIFTALHLYSLLKL